MNPTYKFANTQVTVPSNISSVIQEFGSYIPDSELYIDPNDNSYGREDDTHITVRYGLDIKTPERIIQVSECLQFQVNFGRVSIFEAKDYDVLKIDIGSAGLKKANALLGMLVPFPGETHKDYSPHCTIAYLKKGFSQKYTDASFHEYSFIAEEITFINIYKERYTLNKYGDITHA